MKTLIQIITIIGIFCSFSFAEDVENLKQRNVDSFKQKKIPNEQKKDFITSLIIWRMNKFGAVDPNRGIRLKYTKRELEGLKQAPVHIIFGFPDGAIMTILESYWYLKLVKRRNNTSIYAEIETERVNIGFPHGIPTGTFSLRDFIIYRIRLEEPEIWKEENITDDELDYSIKSASEYCENYFSR